MSTVAIVVPVFRNTLSEDEEYSLRHLHVYLGCYDCFQLSPRSLSLRVEGLKYLPEEDGWFTSVDSYSKLCLSKAFYEKFKTYEHLLIYQLDCLVFRNELQYWCERDYDYVGAPLFNVKGDPSSGFSGACNGGFSLRRVKAFLRVLNSRRYLQQKVPFTADLFHEPFINIRPLGLFERIKKRIQVAREVRQGIEVYTACYSVNEDHFWSGRASYFEPLFRVAPPLESLSFAFESAPSYCFERNNRRLPFGSHAWQKYERGFWEKYLIRA